MPRHQPAIPLTEAQRQLVEENYKLVFAGCKKYRRGDIDRELMEAEFSTTKTISKIISKIFSSALTLQPIGYIVLVQE